LINYLYDPTHGKEEALGCVFNALAITFDFKEIGAEVIVLFNGTGTRSTIKSCVFIFFK